MFPLLRRAPVFLLAACALVGAAPHVDVESQSDKRGLGLGLLGAAQTVETVNLEETPEGLVTTRCLVTLTPVIELGEELVVESKECVVTLASDGSNIIINGSNGSNNNNNNNNNDNNNNNNNNGSSNTFTTATDTFTDTSTDISFTSTSLSSFTTSSVDSSANTFFSTPELSTSTELSTATASSSIETGTALGAQNTQPAVSTEALSSVPNTAAIASATAPPAVTTAAVSSIAVSAIQSGTAAAADNSPSASTTPFTLPGKKLQVLPIGLGVFAGISVIALIVVGLVTYERTKYRKAFRQRKLAEAGASMGYGGMSQRV